MPWHLKYKVIKDIDVLLIHDSNTEMTEIIKKYILSPIKMLLAF